MLQRVKPNEPGDLGTSGKAPMPLLFLAFYCKEVKHGDGLISCGFVQQIPRAVGVH